jgi:hypothetical protein
VRSASLCLFVPLVTTVGCVHETATEVVSDDIATAEPPRAVPGETAEVAVAYDGQGDEATSTAEQGPSGWAVVRQGRDPIFFHLGAGYGALGHIDLAACREEGLQPGYVRVRVTFERTGHVVHASVRSMATPSQQALACIGEQLEMASVPRFDGDDVTLSKMFFVN